MAGSLPLLRICLLTWHMTDPLSSDRTLACLAWHMTGSLFPTTYLPINMTYDCPPTSDRTLACLSWHMTSSPLLTEHCPDICYIFCFSFSTLQNCNTEKIRKIQDCYNSELSSVLGHQIFTMKEAMVILHCSGRVEKADSCFAHVSVVYSSQRYSTNTLARDPGPAWVTDTACSLYGGGWKILANINYFI